MRWRVFVLLFVAWISLNLLFIILNYLDNVKAGAPYMEALMLSIYRSIKSSWVIHGCVCIYYVPNHIIHCLRGELLYNHA